MNWRLSRIWIAAGLVACLSIFAGTAALAQSQASTGVIQGTVEDQSGGVLPGTTIYLEQNETGFERVVITDDEGRFLARLLPVGPYTVKAELEGFKAVERPVRLTIGATLTLRITMEIGEMQEVVSVSADYAPLIETSSSLPQATVNETAIDNLPINGRDFQSFIFLTPGAVQASRNTISVGGAKGIETNFQIDGADRNNAFFGGQSGGDRPPFTFSQEAIGEFVVVNNGYSAEFGRATAGLVNVVSKSGTNSWHGSAFYLFQNDSMLGNEVTRSVDSAFQISEREIEPESTRHQFGGSFGGPIVRDKLFFFFSTEHQEFETPLIVSFFLDDEELAIAPPELINLQGSFNSTDDAQVWNGKVDWVANSSNNFNFRYTFTDSEQVNGTSTGTVDDALSHNGLELDETQQVVFNWNAIISPRVVNEFRFNYLYEDRPRLANASDVTAEVDVSGCCDLGAFFFLPIPEDDDRYQFVNNLSYNFGAHDVKFGVEYNDTGVDQVFRGNFRGNFDFDGLAELLGVCDACDPTPVGGLPGTPFPDAYQQFFGPGDLVVRVQEWAFFVQDDWRATDKLTINLGLRWEGQYNPENDRPNTDFPAFAEKIVDDTDNWAPRIGFAYDPAQDGKTVIRGSAGIFYARTPTLLFSNPLRVNGEVTNGSTLFFGGDLARQVPLNFNGDSFPGLGTAFSDLSQAAGLLGITLPSSGTIGRVNLHALDFENPESYRFTFGVERELAPNWVAGISYTHAQTRHMQTRLDINLFRGVENEFGREIFNTSTRPQGDITGDDIRLVESSGRGEYDALSLTLSKRFSDRFQFNANYTLGYNDDENNNERDANTVHPVNPFKKFQEFGRSDYDIRHNFVLNGVLELPGDFQISGIIDARSGSPFSITTGTDTNRDGEFNDRAVITTATQTPGSSEFRRGTATAHTSCEGLFDKGLSGDCVEGQMLDRNSFNNNKIVTVDMRITKKFFVSEGAFASAFIEFFNLFNGRNFVVTQFDINDNALGIGDRQGSDPFAMQIGFRFDF
ncbi:MAG TPA: TonB-dependent receptor [Acidobacteriota bacterium]|nr:TonB-dependent receptor [Acidobacteriota bacterium]